MITADQLKRVRSLRARRFTTSQICSMTGLQPEQLKEAMAGRYYGTREHGPEQVIDGEPIGERIERLKKDIREGRLVIQRATKEQEAFGD